MPSKENTTKARILDGAIGAVFAIIVGVILFFFTGNHPNTPHVVGRVRTTGIEFPLHYVPRDSDLKNRASALDALRDKDRRTYDQIMDGILNVETYQKLRLFSESQCYFTFELKNTSTVKTANTTILIPDVIAFWTGSNDKTEVTQNEKIPVGDLLPNETKTLKVLTRYGCPSQYEKINNDKIYLSFDGGSGELDFFPELPTLAKFVLKNDLWISGFLFLCVVGLAWLSIFLIVWLVTKAKENSQAHRKTAPVRKRS